MAENKDIIKLSSLIVNNQPINETNFVPDTVELSNEVSNYKPIKISDFKKTIIVVDEIQENGNYQPETCQNAYDPNKVSMYVDQQKNETLMSNYYTIEEIEEILSGKTNVDSVYTKDETYNKNEVYNLEEIDFLLSLKANKVDVYSKIDMNTLLDLKANKNEIYDKNEIDEILGSYYTKLDIDTILENKANIEDVIAISGQVLTNIEDIEYLETNKQDKLIAGDNITISGNVISADDEIDPVFKAWLDTNAVYLAVLLNEQPTNPENKYLNALRQWIEVAIGGAGYEAPLYYTNINSATHIIGSDTLFYKKISYQPEVGETPLTVQSKDNVRTLIGTYLYDAQIATTTIDSGNFGFKLKCKVNNVQGTNVIEYVPFLYHIDGTRTDLFTCISDPITNTTFLDNFKQFPSDTIHCVETDRLGVDVYFKSSSNAFKTLDALIGDGHASYMVTPLRLRHDGLRDLDGNPNFLHVNEEQKALIISTAEIVSGHTEDISDLQTNKQDKLIAGNNITISDNVISADLNDYLTTDEALNTYETIANVNLLSDVVSTNTEDISNKADKATTLSGYGITNAYTKTEIDTKLNSTDIISTNVTNNSGIIVIDTTPNWQRVNISSGVDTLILDYENGILPTKNREYLLVINNASTRTKIITLPTETFVQGGITYNFMNTVGSIPINSGKSIEVNVVFFFIDVTTCNIRTQITQFI